MEDDLKKNKKMEDDLKKNGRRPKKIENLFSIPYKFRENLSWDWLSSLRFLFVLFIVLI
jgi:hypothetical protein